MADARDAAGVQLSSVLQAYACCQHRNAAGLLPSVDLSPSTENLRGRFVTLTARVVMSTPRGQVRAAARCRYSFHLYRACYFAGSVFAFEGGAGAGAGVMPWGEMVFAF